MDGADLASSLMSMSMAKTQFSASIAVLKKQLEMQKLAVDMLVPVKAAPSPGTGLVVDKTA